MKQSIYAIIQNLKFYTSKCYSGLSHAYFIQIAILTFLNCTTPFAFVLFPRYIIGELMDKRRIDLLFAYVLTWISIQLLAKVATEYLNKKLADTNVRLVNELELALSYQYTCIEYHYMENSSYIEMGNRAKRCIQEINGIKGISNILSNAISQVIIIIGMASIVSNIAPILLFIMPFCLIMNPIIKNKLNRVNNEYFIKTAPIDRKYSHYFGYMLDFKYGKDIRMYNMHDFIKTKTEFMIDDLYKYHHERSVHINRYHVMMTLLQYLQIAIFYAYTVYQIVLNKILAADFIMYINAITMLSQSLSELIYGLLDLKRYGELLQDYHDFYMLPTTEKMTYDMNHNISEFKSIEFVNVSFRYPNTEIDVLKDVSFSISQQEKVAIVGRNGVGKSTVIKLLLQYYQPSSGYILLNGVNIHDLSPDNYRHLFAVVFQDFQLFAGSIAENISLSYNVDEKRMSDTVMQSDIQGTLFQNRGLETEIYKIFSEDGIVPSGGESQKIAMARAIYRNAPFMVLDEPTAALDPASEYTMYQNFLGIIQGKSAIFISHRLSSCKFCDKILVLQDGRIIEQGIHEKLMRQNGVYATMFRIQAEYYQ